MIRSFVLAAATASLASAAPALAQDTDPLALPDVAASVDANADDGGDNFTIGLGASYLPSYEGSDDYVFSPAGIVRGRVSGFNFYSRATALYVDLVREAPDAAVNVEIGPMVNVRLDRSSRIKDARVRRLGELDVAIEPGVFLGATKNKVLHGYDFLTARLDVTHDVTDTHDSTIITPNLEYGTPLSTSFFLGASVSADHVGGGFANSYFSITPAGAVASGLSAYDADGGWKNVRGTLLATYSLTGNLRKGPAIFAVGSYSELLGDFKRSPIVRDAGDATQFFAALGLSYSF